MKKILVITAFVAISFVLRGQEVNFTNMPNWQSVLDEAKKERKYIFVDVYASWCVPCKIMDQQVFKNQKIGKVINDKFIAVKVQADRAPNDKAETQSWYEDAAKIAFIHKVTGYPTQLYFGPDGKLVFRNAGFQGIDQLLKTIKFALDPAVREMGNKIKEYQDGKKDYQVMASMIKVVYYTLDNFQLAKEMAADYNRNFLNKQKDTGLIINRENMEIAYRLSDTLKSSDKIFQMVIAKNQADVDKMADNWTGVANNLTEIVARKEELEEKLWKNGKAVKPNPNWNNLQQTIRKKYSQIDAAKVVREYRLDFYNRTGNLLMKNKYYGIEVKRLAEAKNYFQINMICWHQYFRKVTDRQSLQIALNWIDTCISLTKKANPLSIPWQESDTKAALLYKLGHQTAAIKFEMEMIEAQQRENMKSGRNENDCGSTYSLMDNLDALDQMKRGEKIYLNESVVYASDWKLLD